MPDTQKPTVGRIVHYVSFGTPGGEFHSQCRAAIVAGVPYDQPVDGSTDLELAILNPTGLFFNTVPEAQVEPQPGSWHWPERS